MLAGAAFVFVHGAGPGRGRWRGRDAEPLIVALGALFAGPAAVAATRVETAYTTCAVGSAHALAFETFAAFVTLPTALSATDGIDPAFRVFARVGAKAAAGRRAGEIFFAGSAGTTTSVRPAGSTFAVGDALPPIQQTGAGAVVVDRLEVGRALTVGVTRGQTVGLQAGAIDAVVI